MYICLKCTRFLKINAGNSLRVRLVLWGWGLRTDRVYIILSQPCRLTFFNNNNNNWFDSNCPRAYDAKQTAYRAWSRDRGADRWNQFVHSRTEAQRLYGVAMASNNERARRTLTSTTCSHKWWETLKGSIFGEKPSIPALRDLHGALVVSPAEKASLLGALFYSKQCREQFVTPLSCFPRPVCNSLAFRTSVLHCLLLDLD